MTQYDSARLKVPALPLTGTCDGCRAPNGVLTGEANEYHCPECARRYAIGARASEHLQSLIGQVLNLWEGTWGPEIARYRLHELELTLTHLRDEARITADCISNAAD